MVTSPVPSKNLVECPACSGEGFSNKSGRCARCNGSGRLVVRETSEGVFKETSLLLD